MILPCKDCLILGICKHKAIIKCSLLYEYVITVHAPKSYVVVREKLGEVYGERAINRVEVCREVWNEEGEFVWI